MEEAIDTEIIKATQVSLGKYVKRPPLSDKLLKKPPFRFLHDIITSVIKSTGLFKGLIEDEELKSDNVKDRESKILFLSKVITVLEITTGKTLAAKPSKIIAGQEPEKTNDLLQCIAFALDNKLSSDEAVKQYKGNSGVNALNDKKSKIGNKSIKKGSDTKKLTSKSSEKLVKSERNPSKTRQTDKKESPPKKSSHSSSKIINKKTQDKEKREHKQAVNKIDNIALVADLAQNSIDTDVNIIDNLKITSEIENATQSILDTAETKKINDVSSDLLQNDVCNLSQGFLDYKENEISVENNVKDNSQDIESVINKNENLSIDVSNNDLNTNTTFESNQAPISINENVTLPEQDENRNSDAEVKSNEPKVEITYVKRPNSVRPSSSRPGAPRLRDKHENPLSAADNLVVGKVNIIAENTTQEEEEETSIVIVESTDSLSNTQVPEDQLHTSDQHGHLVQQILEAQKEFSDELSKTNIEWKFGGQKSRDVLNQDIEQLRFNVQALSRVANPLGKLLDHIQEDVEVMRQELQQWTKSYDDATKELLKQKAANEESLYPLNSKVKQLEADIGEKREKINDHKIIIHKNALRIEKLLASGHVQ